MGDDPATPGARVVMLPLTNHYIYMANEADVLALVDVYAAGEAPVPGITSEALANGIREAGHKNVQYFRSMQDAIEFLLREARPGDAILTIGAGNVSRASSELMVLLGAELRVEDRIRNAD